MPRPWGKQGGEAASFKMVTSNFIFLFCQTVKLSIKCLLPREPAAVSKKSLTKLSARQEFPVPVLLMKFDSASHKKKKKSPPSKSHGV